RVEPDPSERLVRRDDPLRIGLLDPERPHLGAPERRAVPTERRGDRSYVGPRADAQVEPNDPVAIGNDVERVHAGAPERHLDRLATPVQPVGALTADLDRRGGRNRQLDLAAEAREPALELVRARSIVPLHYVTLAIASIRHGTQVHIRRVALVQPNEA